MKIFFVPLFLVSYSVQFFWQVLFFTEDEQCKFFDQPTIHRVKTDQINGLGSHDGGICWKIQQFHPQEIHNLLDYLNTTTSFTELGKKNKAIKQNKFWIGPGLTFLQKEALFKKYKIVNREHNKENAYREHKTSEGTGVDLVIEDRLKF